MFHDLISYWFYIIEEWGYGGIFILMVIESSFIPFPSEIVIPPAAFWAAQGRFDFNLVVLMGTLGSYVGALFNYVLARYFGGVFIQKFGKYIFLNETKFAIAKKWVSQHGAFGIFSARLLPAIRQLVSLPAGLFHMNFVSFSFVTLAGAGLWCLVLAWYGEQILGDHPELLDSPEAMIATIKSELWWLIAGVLILIGLYIWVVRPYNFYLYLFIFPEFNFSK